MTLVNHVQNDGNASGIRQECRRHTIKSIRMIQNVRDILIEVIQGALD